MLNGAILSGSRKQRPHRRQSKAECTEHKNDLIRCASGPFKPRPGIVEEESIQAEIKPCRRESTRRFVRMSWYRRSRHPLWPSQRLVQQPGSYRRPHKTKPMSARPECLRSSRRFHDRTGLESPNPFLQPSMSALVRADSLIMQDRISEKSLRLYLASSKSHLSRKSTRNVS